MSRTLLRVPIEDGAEEFIEVEVDSRDLPESTLEDVRLASGSDEHVATASFSLASSVHRIMPALSSLLGRLRSAEHAPDEISMELGLTVGGETGLIFAKGTAEATFTVALTWHKPPAGGPVAGALDAH